MDRQVPSSALQARRRRDREGAGALMRPGAEGRITPKDKSSDFRNGWADSTFAASPASCPQLLIRDPGQGGAKSRELRIDGVLGRSKLLWCSDVFCALAHIHSSNTGVC